MNKKIILITGFDPFNNDYINPSYEAIKLLPDFIGNNLTIKKEIPTEFFRSKDVMISLTTEYKPDIILNVGLAGGRQYISIETTAYNLIDASIADNNHYQPHNELIDLNGEDMLSSTLPILSIEEALKDNNIDYILSNNPGRFVCNYIMYSMLSITKNTNIKVGFIHVPYIKEQVLNKNLPYLELDEIAKQLLICIKAILDN